jgi:branched-chain amino acid transport system substrate-binding protein
VLKKGNNIYRGKNIKGGFIMKKSLKKILSLGLVSALAISLLAGCGKKSAGDSTEFIIGGLGPLSGEAASYGISVKQGAEIAIEEINAAGGVKVGDQTLKLSLNFKDDEASGETALSAYNTLMDEGTQALLGTVTSGAGLAIGEKIAEDGILQVTPSGSAAGLTEWPNAFRLCFTDPLQGQTMARYAVEDLGLKKIAVIFNNADEYSTGVKDAFVAEVATLGGEIVAEESFEKGAVDFKTQLTKIKGTDAEIIFAPVYYGDAAFITTQAAELGMSLPYIGSDGWDGVLAQVVDPAVLEGAVFLSPFLATDETPAVQAFVKAYDEAYKAVPDQFAADGYDTVYVMKAALEKAGSTDSEALIAAMTEIQVEGLTGSVTFTAEGEPNKGAKFVQIVNGEYTLAK